MKKTFTLLLVMSYFVCLATTYEVGSTKTYISPNALYTANVVQDGDVIEIDAEDYVGQAALAVWHGDDLIIRGIGGRPHLIANGQYIWGKGIWVFAGNNITVENVEFSGAMVPDHNGAGIRLDGIGMTVRNCYFHENENGILSNNPNEGTILIEYSEFAYSGYGSGYTHNLYIGHCDKLIFRFNYSHHADVGHNLKSRATENYIYCNRIMDEELGASSRLIDLPNGGLSILMGNVLMQGANAPNWNLVGYGKEGLSNPGPHELHFINNTMINKRGNGIFVDIQGGTTVANISNNIFGGAGTPVNGSTTTMDNNLIDTDISALYLVDEMNYDYDLESNSPAVDMGTTVDSVYGYSLTPDSSYIHPTNFQLRSIINDNIDVGAYEFGEIVSTNGIEVSTTHIYPNPTKGYIYIENNLDVKHIDVFNSLGQKINLILEENYIDVSKLPQGIYRLNIVFVDDSVISKIISKL